MTRGGDEGVAPAAPLVSGLESCPAEGPELGVPARDGRPLGPEMPRRAAAPVTDDSRFEARCKLHLSWR